MHTKLSDQSYLVNFGHVLQSCPGVLTDDVIPAWPRHWRPLLWTWNRNSEVRNGHKKWHEVGKVRSGHKVLSPQSYRVRQWYTHPYCCCRNHCSRGEWTWLHRGCQTVNSHWSRCAVAPETANLGEGQAARLSSSLGTLALTGRMWDRQQTWRVNLDKITRRQVEDSLTMMACPGPQK